MASKKRLIDANELLEKHTCDVYGAYDDSCMVQAVFVPYIKGAPTVDAVEVVHGRWEKHQRDTFAKEHRCEKLRCTYCRHYFYHNYGDNKLYCPNCGAKMDGGDME